jgi:hypothetical protein
VLIEYGRFHPLQLPKNFPNVITIASDDVRIPVENQRPVTDADKGHIAQQCYQIMPISARKKL